MTAEMAEPPAAWIRHHKPLSALLKRSFMLRQSHSSTANGRHVSSFFIFQLVGSFDNHCLIVLIFGSNFSPELLRLRSTPIGEDYVALQPPFIRSWIS